MTTSTHLYGQLFNQLRQHSRVGDLRHLKALAWMVSALLCSGELNASGMGALCTGSGNQSAKYRATLAAVYGQWADWGHSNLPTVSPEQLEWMEAAAIVFSPGYHRAVGSVLHDPPVGRKAVDGQYRCCGGC